MTDSLATKFTSEEFDSKAYVNSLTLRCIGVEDLLTTRDKIQKLADDTNGLLKKNVYKNYTQFIDTAKEISYLESEMYQLSHMLTEQQNVLNSVLDVSIAGGKCIRPEKSNQVAEQNSKNLASLLEKVEGCASIFEEKETSVIKSTEFVELCLSDFRPLKQVYCILLTDGFMIAGKSERKRGPLEYTFETLYELDNLAIVNLKDDSTVKNSFKILVFPHSRLFQCPNAMVKNEWLSLFEQAKKKKMSSIKRQLSHSDSNPFFDDESTNPFSEDESRSFDKDSDCELPNWLIELPEDLDVFIAQREFEQAVQLIKKATLHLSSFPKNSTTKEIRSKFDTRVKRLIGVVKNELKLTPDRSLHGGLRSARRAVHALLSLGKSSVACDLFLRHRTAVLKHSLKQQTMSGATAPYIEKLCSIFFVSLIESGQEFNKAFSSNNSCASAYVVWSKNQLGHFIQIFSRHVFTPQVTASVSAECIAHARQHCNQLLEIGLDLSFELNNLLQTYVERLINEIRDKSLEAIKLRSNDDKWRPQNHQNSLNLRRFLDDIKEIGIENIESYVYDDCWLSLTANTTAFGKMYLNFVDDLLKLYTQTAHLLVNEALFVTFQAQITHIAYAYQGSMENEDRKFISKNAQFLHDSILPIAGKHYMAKIGLMFPQISELRAELSKFFASGKPSISKYSSTVYV